METKRHDNVNQHHKKTAQDRLRVIISSIAAFLLSMALTLITVLLVIQWSGFSRSSFYKNMSANNYYDFVMTDIYEEAEAITIPIGLPVTVLEDVLTSYGISKDVNGYIDASFRNDTYNVNTEDITEKLENNVRTYLTEAGIALDQDQETNLEAYVASVVKVYTDTVKMPLLSAFVKARNLYEKIFGISIAICAVFAAICLYMIIRLHTWLHRGLRYVTYSTISTGLMSGIMPVLVLQSGFYKKIHLSPEYFYNFFTDYVTNIFQAFLNFSVGWIILSIIIIVVIGALKNSREYYKRKN